MIGYHLSHTVQKLFNAELDIPQEPLDQEFFQWFVTAHDSDVMMQDILIAHQVIDSGMPNRFGCRIPLK